MNNFITNNNQPLNNQCGCNNVNGETIYTTCPPIVTCSKQVVNKYFITRQPYIHEYHTEVVNHYITENEYIPKYTCSNINVNDGVKNR